MTIRPRSWYPIVYLAAAWGCAAACAAGQTSTGTEGPPVSTSGTGGGLGGGGNGGSPNAEQGAASGSGGGGSTSGGGAGTGKTASGGGAGSTAGGGGGTTRGTTGSSGSTTAGGGSRDAGAAPSSTAQPPSPPGALCLKPGGGDYTKAGPYQVQTEEIDLGMNIDSNEQTGKFTIFYPQPFETSCLHPVVAWGNGTGVTGPTTYGFFNQNAASYGIVVIAAEDPDTGSGNYHVAGINYMTQQNADSSSKYYQKLDLKGVGVAGHSQGAIGATAGADKIANTAAEVCVAGGGTLPATVSFLGLTGTQDILESMTKSTFQSVPGPAFLADWDGGDHFTTETLAGFVAQNPGTIQMMGLYAAWFRCWLAGDQAACKVFQGAPTSCGACTNSGWATLAERNM